MDVEEEVGDLRAAQHAVNTRSDQQAAELARIAEEVNGEKELPQLSLPFSLLISAN
jgi:hypothetical protein